MRGTRYRRLRTRCAHPGPGTVKPSQRRRALRKRRVEGTNRSASSKRLGRGWVESLSRDHPSDPPGASLREPHFEKILGWSPWPRSPQDARSPVLTHAPRGHPVAPPLPARTAVDTATEAEPCLFRPSRSNPNQINVVARYTAVQNHCSDTQQLLPSPPYTPSGSDSKPVQCGFESHRGHQESAGQRRFRH